MSACADCGGTGNRQNVYGQDYACPSCGGSGTMSAKSEYPRAYCSGVDGRWFVIWSHDHTSSMPDARTARLCARAGRLEWAIRYVVSDATWLAILVMKDFPSAAGQMMESLSALNAIMLEITGKESDG